MSLKHLSLKFARNPAFKKITDSDVRTLSGIVGGGSNALQTLASGAAAATKGDMDPLVPYSIDYTKQAQGDPPLVLFPRSTEEVSVLLKYCNKERIAVTPQSGNTGLVYGSIPIHDEVIVSTSKMTTPMKIHEETFSTTIGAGVVLQSIQEEAARHELLFPLDMGSKGSAQAGGFVSTNAGGIYFARYGSVRSNLLALEAVTASGEVLSTMNRLVNGEPQAIRAVRKDNVGYDLKQLFVASEGTLGIVTQAEFQLHPAPRSHNVLLFHVHTFADVLALYRLCKVFLGDGLLSACEVMDTAGLQNAHQLRSSSTPPFPVQGVTGSSFASPTFTVLVEAQGSNQAADEQRVMQLVQLVNGEVSDAAAGSGSSVGELEEMIRRVGFRQQEAVIDQVMAMDDAQRARIWTYREHLPVNIFRSGVAFAFDISFPLDQFYAPIDYARHMVVKDLLGLNLDDVVKQGAASPDQAKVDNLFANDLILTGYGHFGDGNVHLHMSDTTRDHHLVEYCAHVSHCVNVFCATRGGSVSAEHGIGTYKREYLPISRTAQYNESMRSIKKLFDPNGILNPYKIF